MDKKRKYCHHCDSEVSKSTYYEHLALKEAGVYHDNGHDEEFQDASVEDSYYCGSGETISFTSEESVNDGKLL